MIPEHAQVRGAADVDVPACRAGLEISNGNANALPARAARRAGAERVLWRGTKPLVTRDAPHVLDRCETTGPPAGGTSSTSFATLAPAVVARDRVAGCARFAGGAGSTVRSRIGQLCLPETHLIRSVGRPVLSVTSQARYVQGAAPIGPRVRAPSRCFCVPSVSVTRCSSSSDGCSFAEPSLFHVELAKVPDARVGPRSPTHGPHGEERDSAIARTSSSSSFRRRPGV